MLFKFALKHAIMKAQNKRKVSEWVGRIRVRFLADGIGFRVINCHY